MRIYFLSEKPCSLLMDGIYLGVVGLSQKFVDYSDGDITCQFIFHDENIEQKSIILNQKFLNNPYDDFNIYKTDDCVIIELNKFDYKNKDYKIIKEFDGRFKATIFSYGNACVALKNETKHNLINMLSPFSTFEIDEIDLNGNTFLAVREYEINDEGFILYLIDNNLKLCFKQKLQSFMIENNSIKTIINYKNCLESKAEVVWIYDKEFKVKNYRIIDEKKEIDINKIYDFVFFEKLLINDSPETLICDDFKAKLPFLKEYLGNYIDVFTPLPEFYLAHGNILAVGLIYPERENLFTIKYFTTEKVNGKISNVLPLE